MKKLSICEVMGIDKEGREYSRNFIFSDITTAIACSAYYKDCLALGYPPIVIKEITYGDLGFDIEDIEIGRLESSEIKQIVEESRYRS